MSAPFCQALLPNARGHDYFVGDVHGRFSRLEHALAERGFDPACDRLMMVGDLIDRGPESPRALAWLQQPFVHSIRGNHEALFLQWFALRHDVPAQRLFLNQSYRKAGGGWVEDEPLRFHAALAQAVDALPHVLVVPYQGRTIGMVHAEFPLPAAWPQVLTDEAALTPESRRGYYQQLLWGRTQARLCQTEAGDEPWLPGFDAVVVGHTPMERPMPWGSMLFLDTGAWQPPRRPFWLLRADEVLGLIDGTLDALQWPCPVGRPPQ